MDAVEQDTQSNEQKVTKIKKNIVQLSVKSCTATSWPGLEQEDR